MRSTRLVVTGGALLCALIAPPAATAATKPVVTTGGSANLTPTSAVVKGTVNPKGAATTYFFQYGTTSLYGASTAPASAGAGTSGVHVAAAITGLAPATTYHYRLVARNAEGLTKGRDRTFRTRRQPLGVSLGASPPVVTFGGKTLLAGVLSGTGNSGRQIVLQSNPYPYTQGFANAADIHLTGSTGGFSFPILSVPVNTQFRVLMPSRPEVVSPVVVVHAKVRATMRTKVRRGERRGRIRFSGRIRPAVDGSQVLIQKRRRSTGAWMTIAETFARHASGRTSSRYVKRVRQRHGGRYRVVANVGGAYAPDATHSKRLRVRR
jgi:hypothetical protein